MAKVAVFTTNSCRILETPGDQQTMLRWPNAVFEPDLNRVKGVLPQFWRLDEGQIFPMSPMEVRCRKKSIERFGIDSAIRRLEPFEFRVELKEMQIIQGMLNEDNKKIYVVIGLLALNILLTLIAIIKK